ITAEAPAETTAVATPQASASTNLTANLASLIGKNIVDKNPEGPIRDGLTVANANRIADEVLAESITMADLDEFHPVIPADELSIGSNPNYSVEIRAALRVHMETLKEKKQGGSFTDDVATVITAYGLSIQEIRNIVTPTERISDQQTILSILNGQLNALTAIRKYESDPVRGIVALRILEELQQKLEIMRI
ncbi:MAG: hypothetical protein Q7R63_01900, partial [bacterium]|nr:hypothetical protein [bacterium]